MANNHVLLTKCDGPHEFEPSEWNNIKTLVRRYRCKKCGGYLDALEVVWYNRGLSHAAKKARIMAHEVIGPICQNVRLIYEQRHICEDIAKAIEPKEL